MICPFDTVVFRILSEFCGNSRGLAPFLCHGKILWVDAIHRVARLTSVIGIGSPHVGYCSYTANLDWSIFLGLGVAQTWDQIR
jgi:hypothetical protein